MQPHEKRRMAMTDAETLVRALSPGDGAIDIGANDGAFARHFAKAVGPTGTVLAVEPDPVNVKKLRETLKEYPQAEIVEAAVWCSNDEPVILHCDTGDRKRNSLWAKNLLGHGAPITATGVTLDDLAAQVNRLKAIKIDAQGAEMEILRGGTETLTRTDLMWMVELWPEGLIHAGSSIQELAARFIESGYHPTKDSWPPIVERLKRCTGHKAADVFLVHRSPD